MKIFKATRLENSTAVLIALLTEGNDMKKVTGTVKRNGERFSAGEELKSFSIFEPCYMHF